MADKVTPSDKTPEQIEQEMLLTRESLTEKVAALESQVVGTVQSAADTITGTVDAVRSLVSHAPETVSDTMKQAVAAVGDTMRDSLDISAHVRRNPWASVGASTMLGCVVGWLVSGSRRPAFDTLSAASAPVYTSPPSNHANEKPGLFDDFVGMIGEKVKELARTALDTASASVKENIQEGVPKLVGDAAARLTEPTANGGAAPFASRYDARRV